MAVKLSSPVSIFFFLYFHVLVCTDRTADRRNVVNISKYVFSHNAGRFGVRLKFLIIIHISCEKYQKFPIPVMLNLSQSFEST